MTHYVNMDIIPALKKLGLVAEDTGVPLTWLRDFRPEDAVYLKAALAGRYLDK